MTVTDWGQIVTDSLLDLWARFIGFLPSLIGALLVLVIGWIVAEAIGRLVRKLIEVLRVDSALSKTVVKDVVEKSGLSLNLSKFLGEVVKWFLLLVFFIAATDILGLSRVGKFLDDVLQYLPNLVIAILILLVGVLFARFAKQVARSSIKAAGFESGDLLGAITQWVIWIFALSAALVQLGVAVFLVQTIITGIIAMLALAGGLAFGLGGRDHAKEILDKIKSDISR